MASRERLRRFDADQAVEIEMASEKTIRVQRVESEDSAEIRLYCHSEMHQDKENGITGRFVEQFERGLAKIAVALQSPCGEKKRDRGLQRIGSLQEKCHGIHDRLTTFSRIFAGQCRIPATF